MPIFPTGGPKPILRCSTGFVSLASDFFGKKCDIFKTGRASYVKRKTLGSSDQWLHKTQGS
jgi:hypothetical protein